MSKNVNWKTDDRTCDACAAAQIAAEFCKHVRGGKTQFEREAGTLTNRHANRAARVAWQQDSGPAAFPRASCNGKRNRFA